MMNTSIAGTSPDRYRYVIRLPRCGGSASQISKEEKVTDIIADNQEN
jgi:hypothetical protein